MPSSSCRAVRLAALAFLVLQGGCRHRHSSSEVIGAAQFAPDAPVFLDATLRVGFDAAIDPASLTASAAEVVAVDGPGLGERAVGSWRAAGAAIEFVPELAHAAPVTTGGGLLPATRYELRVHGDGVPGGLRAADGRPIASATFQFVTRAGDRAAQLFGSNVPGGPRLVGVDVEPRDGAGDWQLGRAFAPAAMRLSFDQPLGPSVDNLPNAATAASSGAILLTWHDPVWGAATVADCEVDLVQNNAEGATVVLRPRGVLPSHAAMQLRIAPSLRDLFGEDNAGAFVEPVRTFRTEADDGPHQDALCFDFAAGAVPGAADFGEVPAVVEDGALRVPDAFPAVDAGVGDWVPLAPETVLRTGVQELLYQNGASRTFVGGVLQTRNLLVPAGHVVRGKGPNPLVIVVDGDARIEGTLSVDGDDGREPNWGMYRGPGDIVPPAPAGGGTGWQGPPPIGANGGPAAGWGGSVVALLSPLPSMAGGTAVGVANGGGQGGQATCAYADQASGGGGGGGAVQGDPWFPTPPGAGGAFPQRHGEGGQGINALAGGAPGSTWFANGDPSDDFWGRAWIPRRGRCVVGELSAPRGGSGGGSGGGTGFGTSCPPPSSGYGTGGPGGGGGGVLVLQVRGRLTIAATARISADGGDGIGGIHYTLPGGGGGGGAGTIVLMAGDGIELHVHGETFANRDYDFSISADGGICVTPSPAPPPLLLSKYPANGEPTFAGEAYDQHGLGGFGGMGLVQLMVPIGRDNADGTNTMLDDAITVVRDGVSLWGADKQRYLGWRGFADENGAYVDDFGAPTGTIGGQGDIRPDPVLLPVPYAENGTARARSAWLSLGALHRRQLPAPDGLPRGVVGEPTTFGAHARSDGWLPYGDGRLSPQTSGVALLAAPVPIAQVTVDQTTLAVQALALELSADLPETAPGGYTGCVADIGGVAGGSFTRRRVLHSAARTLLVDGELRLPNGAARVQLLGWFAELATPEPDSYVGAGGVLLPRANVRIGFAFHRAPATALAAGYDAERFPPEVGTFLSDLTAPATRAALRAFGPRAVQWDVLLDGEWRSRAGDQPPRAGPGSAIALRRFFVPVRY